MTQNTGTELGWNDTIENDGEGFQILPAGDYHYTITGFERARHPGSDKLPPCNKAIVSVRVANEQASGTLKHNLFLHTKTEGLLCEFFRSIGQRKHGERLTMDWGKVTGSTGKCKVSVRKWTKQNGDIAESNEIKFLDPEEPAETAKPAGWKAGEF